MNLSLRHVCRSLFAVCFLLGSCAHPQATPGPTPPPLPTKEYPYEVFGPLNLQSSKHLSETTKVFTMPASIHGPFTISVMDSGPSPKREGSGKHDDDASDSKDNSATGRHSDHDHDCDVNVKGASGDGQESHGHRSFCASITLNGTQLFAAQDFATGTPLLTSTVSLQSSNTLVVDLQGDAGRMLTVALSGFRTLTVAQHFDWLKADQSKISINTPTTLTITAQLGYDPALLGNSVTLSRYDDQGRFVAPMGQMYDDGTHGDQLAGDRVFATTITFNEAAPSVVILKASASYAGVELPVFSPLATVFVQVNATPEEALAEAAKQIAAGNIDEALKFFDSDSSSVGILTHLNNRTRRDFADYLRSLHLVHELNAENGIKVRTYKGPMKTPDGHTREIELQMSQTPIGNWIIFNW